MKQLYFNGTILTMDERCPEAMAVLVTDGVISKVGCLSELEKETDVDTERIDLCGNTMLPGFIDSHSHFTAFANSLDQCDLTGVTSFEELIDRMKQFIEERQIPEDTWVSGVNYDQNFMIEKRHPDKKILDRISKKHPIVVVHASSHMGVANSLALTKHGLTKETKDPEGGRYERESETGELTGYMEENAFVGFREKIPMVSIDKMFALMLEAQKVYAGYGITTVQEGMTPAVLWPLLWEAKKQNLLFLDLVAYLDTACGKQIMEQYGIQAKDPYDHHLRIGGFKTFLDGSPQGKTAWMKEPYLGERTECGYPVKTDAALYEEMEQAYQCKMQLLAHCNGDAAAEQFITQYEKLAAAHPMLDFHRPVMVHAQFLEREQLPRMKALGMMPSFFVAHTYYWGDIHLQNLGKERGDYMSPAGSARRLEIPFTFHQDTPVIRPNMLESIMFAVKRTTKNGVALARSEAVSVYDGLKAVTIWAAYQYGEEAKKGSIEEGKLADFVVLDKNPLKTPVDQLDQIKVLVTYKEGKEIHRAALAE